MPTLIKVALASDNSQLLDRVRAGLAAEKAIRIVGEAREGKEAVALVNQRRPTLLVVDLALPPAGGLPVVAQVRKGSPKTRVLAIDERLNEQRVLRLARAGAYGYILGDAIPAYLAKAVRVMAAGEVWLSRKLMGKVVEELQRLVQLRARAGGRRGGLTPGPRNQGLTRIGRVALKDGSKEEARRLSRYLRLGLVDGNYPDYFIIVEKSVSALKNLGLTGYPDVGNFRHTP